jgi:hypothetical protein
MIAKKHNEHTTDKGEQVLIEYIQFNYSYMVYVNGIFQESLDKYDTDDMKRLKMWERL